jgi:hypothetical protein
MVLQLLAGAGIGLLLGLLVGLSSSHVVATVVGAIAGGLLILLGLHSSKDDASGTPPPTTWRLAGFGFACTLALIVSVWIRAHHSLSPPIKEQVKELTDVGYSPEDARAWVAYVDSGLMISGGKPVEQAKDTGPSAASASSLLFASEGKVDTCGLLNPGRYKDQNEQINAMRLQGGTWASYASYVEQLDAGHRDTALTSAKKLLCP